MLKINFEGAIFLAAWAGTWFDFSGVALLKRAKTCMAAHTGVFYQLELREDRGPPSNDLNSTRYDHREQHRLSYTRDANEPESNGLQVSISERDCAQRLVYMRFPQLTKRVHNR